MKKSLWLIVATTLAVFMVACGGGADATADAEVDESSGLVINPDGLDIGEPYIVEGTVKSLNLIPNDRPEFLIVVDSGRQYRINAQPVGEITDGDGNALTVTDFQLGQAVRATVDYDDQLNGGLGGLASTDFTVVNLIPTE